MDEWTWITRAGVAMALVLSVGNTAKLWQEARRRHREEQLEAEAVRQLGRIVRMLDDHGPGGVLQTWVMHEKDRPGIELGLKRGVLQQSFDGSEWRIRLTIPSDAK